MRIIAIRVRPICIAFSCLYAVVGLLSFIQYCFLEEMQQFTLPIGIIMPFVYFTFNLKIPRSMTESAPVAYLIAAVFVYAVSGCATGLAGTYLFNFIARMMGGIDARFVKTADDQLPPASDH
ncbi:MAG: hypothetical protein WBA18_00145 [Terracidiphilus sp.]